MRVPPSTYRLQFNQDFTLRDAAEIVDYLDALGVGDVYASPLLTATRGAAHGYHVTDPAAVNPEVGGPEQLDELHAALDEHGLGLLLDIVPNHLAANTENPWWVDVLEHGRASVRAPAFDIDWDAGDGRVVLPTLGEPLDEVIEHGDLVVGYDDDGLHLRYFDTRLPLDPATYPLVVGGAAGELGDIADEAAALPDRAEGQDVAEERRNAARSVRERLRRAVDDGDDARRLSERIAAVNDDRVALRALVDAQVYDLRFWRTGTDQINYRRFFDITDLVGVRVEDPQVFEARHDRLVEFVQRGIVTGFRVDHVDGLRDPEGYLHDLQEAVGGTYVVVEKIVEGDEPLPESWPVAGTTGYEFLTAVNSLQVDPDGLARLEQAYREHTGRRTQVADTVHERKLAALRDLFAGEVDGLTAAIVDLADDDLATESVRDALIAVTAAFPVYRTYVRGDAIPERDRPYLDRAFEEARRRHPDLDDAALTHVERVLRLEVDGASESVMRWQQLTGPAMAKGFEDTTFYVENRLISLNEVGVDAHSIEDPPGVDAFHEGIARRCRRWPHTMNATSTHDTKRSEDARARLNVLSEIPERWADVVARWSDHHTPPDANEGWMVLQSLVGMWPVDRGEERTVRDRLHRFVEKAAREAKTNTSWLDPDEVYESALHAYVDALLDDRDLVDELRGFVDDIAVAGATNGLAQVALKLGAPGVADTYQGTELWDHSLVDPDNRRPVDYRQRRGFLDALGGDLLETWRDGRVKLHLVTTGLHLRRDDPELFLGGDHHPVRAEGERAGHVVAYARRRDDRWLLVVAPRLPYTLCGSEWALGGVWGDTRLVVPDGAPDRWRDALTDREVGVGLADVLTERPVAFLQAP